MSSAIISTLAFVGQQTTIYLGIFILIAGVVGGLLNVIVFLSLQTFRQSSCAFYLTVMSLVNIGQLITGLLGRIMISGFAIDWTQTSLFYCKFRTYCFLTSSLISLSCFCLATIDQYLATCSRPRWQRWSNIKLARCLSAVTVLFWILYNIPYTIFYNQMPSTTTHTVTCIVKNVVFQQFASYATGLIFGRILPVCITFIFGYLAYLNVQQLTHRTLPLVRRELDKQLTVMVLVQVIVTFFTIVPYVIVYLILMAPDLTKDPVIGAELQFASILTTCIYYMNFASPFFIYLCASNRFRRQLKYVMVDIYLNRGRRRIIAADQVVSHIS